MELEKLNSDYKKYSSGRIGKTVEQLRKKIKDCKDTMEDLEYEKKSLEYSLKTNDVQTNQTLKNATEIELQNVNNKLEKLKEDISRMQNYIEKNRAEVEACIDELSKNPEMKKHIEMQIKKKLIRRAEKKLKENVCLENLKTLIEVEPACKDYISEIKDAKLEMQKQNKEIEKLDPVADAASITTIKAAIDLHRKKYNKNIDLIKKLSKKHNIEFNKDIFSNFIEENSFKKDKQNQYEIGKTIERKIKGNEKSVKNDEIALSKIEGRTIRIGLDESNSLEDAQAEIESSGLPAVRDKNVKWYQFIKRFKNWRENRKNGKSKTESRKEIEEENEKRTSKEFKNIYKYDLVKDYAARYEKEIIGDAKKENKETKSER